MAFVINVNKWLLWTVETMYFNVALGSISWATVLISSHLAMCKTCPVNTPSKHETLTQCWSNTGSLSATLAQHQTSTVSTPCVCRSGSAYCWWRVLADTDPMSVNCWASFAGAGVSIQPWSVLHAGGTIL